MERGAELVRRTTAIIFDMDGLLLDSEIYWERARADFCRSVGCAWTHADELTAKGCNSREWAALIQLHCRLSTPLEAIIEDVSTRMRRLYEEHLPLLPGAIEAVESLHRRYPLGLASSSPPSLIDFAMTEATIRQRFLAVVSADEVGRGKPDPTVFLVTAERLGVPPPQITVFEDSSAGIRAARRAGMGVVAVPNPHFPPDPEVLRQADQVLETLGQVGVVFPDLDLGAGQTGTNFETQAGTAESSDD